MDEVLKMYAMSNGDPYGEPGDLDRGQVEPLEDEDDTAEFEPQTRAALRPTLQPISGEFACLLSVL